MLLGKTTKGDVVLAKKKIDCFRGIPSLCLVQITKAAARDWDVLCLKP